SHYVGAGDLVMPALLVRIEGRPDEADPEAYRRHDEADVTDEGADEVEHGAVGLDHLELEHAHPESLPAAIAGPEEDVVQEAQQSGRTLLGHDAAIRPGGHDRIGQEASDETDDQAVDDDRDETDPESGLLLRRHRHA